MRTIKADAIVVGSGPSGAAAAKRLSDAGYEAVILERQALPRHKPCSGIVSPRGHRFLIENFGPLPEETMHAPQYCRGVVFHFPSAPSLPMEFDGGPTPHLYRKFCDNWMARRSGAKIHAGTEFTGLEDDGKKVTVSARKDGEELRYEARCVIGADGPRLGVVKALYPGYAQSIPWFVVGQKFHAIKSCPLDEDYFHFWFHPGLGHYTWSHARDGRQIVGVGFKSGDAFDPRHARVTGYLRERHGVELGPGEDTEIVTANFGPSLINRYVFGKGNALITGQAAGFFNMIAEGMSCALHSGAIAGEAAAESFRRGTDMQSLYRGMIQSEVRRCSDQWNPLKIAFGRPHEADFRGALKKKAPAERRAIARDIFSFIKLYAPLGWGWQMLRQALLRAVTGRYSPSRWL
ncbi:MAG: FAD-dependent monooxygenase [Elusimicrobia bacterium]|nr:FAD-dependent monooxygenase [Elusimicrobiota bacterium]